MKMLWLRTKFGKVCGLGVQWGKPKTLAVENWRGVRLAVILNYGAADTLTAIEPSMREDWQYIPYCEACCKTTAAVWCRSHGLYCCTGCAMNTHDGCAFLPIPSRDGHGYEYEIA